MSLEVDDHPELIDTLLEYLGDAANPPDRRLAVLNLLQEISFRMVGFPAKRPEYLAVLRSIIEDPDSQLRRVAIGILAREKDDYVQRRLVDGLEGKSKAACSGGQSHPVPRLRRPLRVLPASKADRRGASEPRGEG